jgi:uncharacterized 2Fe-2S/4Fe-4S cluster protein (DUF4445 family)
MMPQPQHNVRFQAQGRTVSVADATPILEAAAGVALVIDNPCGGAGTCGKCRIRAQRIGLIPPDINPQRVHYVGNVSLAGARWALLSLDARAHGEDLARRTRHMGLSMDPEFQAEFANAMIFPHSR